jgi:hypothetical protein
VAEHSLVNTNLLTNCALPREAWSLTPINPVANGKKALAAAEPISGDTDTDFEYEGSSLLAAKLCMQILQRRGSS